METRKCEIKFLENNGTHVRVIDVHIDEYGRYFVPLWAYAWRLI